MDAIAEDAVEVFEGGGVGGGKVGEFEEIDVGPVVEGWEVGFGEVWRSVGLAVVACEVEVISGCSGFVGWRWDGDLAH